VIYNHNNDLEASIKCNCGRLIVLTIKDEKVQLSNYQKHLRTKACTHMNSLKKMHEEEKKSNLQQTTSDLSSSGASSIVAPLTSDTQSTVSKTNLRKRGQTSSQLSS
jgi:hypothetical protein